MSDNSEDIDWGQAVSDLYDSPAAKETSLRQSMIQGSAVNPDEAAKALPIAAQSGLPLDMTARNLPELTKSFNTDHLDYQQMLKDYPKLSNFLSNPDNAAVSHDDIDSLKGVSGFFSRQLDDFPGFLKGIPTGLVSGTGSLLSDIGASAQRGAEKLADGVVNMDNPNQGRQWTVNGWVDTTPAGPVEKWLGQTAAGAVSTLGDGLQYIGKNWSTMGEAIKPADQDIQTQVGETVGGFLPWIAATLATGGEAAAPALFGLGGTGSKLNEEKTSGKYGTAAGDTAAGIYGAVNAVLGGKTFSTLTHTLPDSAVLNIVGALNKRGLPVGGAAEQWITRTLELAYKGAVGGLSMGAIQASSNAADKYVLGDDNKSLTEGVGTQTGLAGAASVILGAMFHAIAKTPTMVDMARANAQKDYFNQSKTVLAGKLLPRSPEKMNELINSQTGGNDVHVNPDALQTFYQSITPEERAKLDTQMPDLNKDIQAAQVTKADMPVNQADFHTYLQPLDRAGQLDDWTKLAPDSMTVGDIKAHDDFMKELFDHVDEQNKNTDNISRDAADTQSSIYDQLIRFTGVGRTPSAMVDVAKLISENPAKFYDAMMKRTGNRADVGDVLNRLIRDVQIRRMLPDTSTLRKGDMDLQLDDLRNAGDEAAKKTAKGKGTKAYKAPTPIQDYIASLGGLRQGSEAAKTLNGQDITKSTHPKLFNKFTPPDEGQRSMLGGVVHDSGKYGLRSLDTLPHSEFEDATGIAPKRADKTDFVDPQWLTDQLRRETDDKTPMSDKDQSRDDLSQYLDYLGMDVHKNSNEQIKRAMAAAEDEQRRALDGVNEHQTFFQGGDNAMDPRGSITFTPDGKAVIHTFSQENLSTVLHEFGHLYWKAMTDIGDLADAPASVVRDIKTMRDWVGAKDGETLSVEQEEKIADGFLSYLRKGESPSADMQGAFSRFKGWLSRIYAGAKDTLPKISDDVKDVFDRMLATDDEIEAIKNTPEFQPDPAIMNMLNKAERERYQAKMTKQIADAKDRLFREAMRQSERENTQLYKDQRAEIEKDATHQISTEKAYVTVDEILKAGGLSKKMIIKEFGKEMVPYLSGHGGIVKTDGIDPAMVASMMGYNNSHEMMDELMNLKPKKQAIQELTDSIMLDRHGDMLKDGTIEGEALKAYHNNLRAEIIHMEMETAAKAAGIPAPSKEAIKSRAVKMLGDMKVKDIIPYRHYQAELKAARAAGVAAGKKDYVATARAKGQQLLNHHLYRMGLDAREQIDKSLTQWRKILGRSDKNIGKALDTDYVYAARYILARHGLGKTSYNFDGWLSQLQRESSPDNPNGDPEAYNAIKDVIDGERNSPPTPYKMLAMSDFQALGDTINGLILTGRDRSKIMIEGQKMELKDAVQAVTDALANRPDSGVSSGLSAKLTATDKARLFIMSANANWRRVEHWVQMVDQGSNGPVRKYIWNPVKKAVLAYRDERTPWMTRIMDTLAPERERLHGEKIPAPELQNDKTAETYTFSDLSELHGMMLHLGNDSNRFKLLKGRGWSEDGMNAFMSRMYSSGIVTKHDLDLRQKLWDMMEELKPRLWQAHKEMYGFRPEEVTASPVMTPHGEYRGGYWPAIVDPEVSEDAQIRADQNAIANTGQSYAFPTAGRGALKSRVESYAGPLQMSMRLLPNHIDWALKFIHIEPAVKDAAKIVMNNDFRTEMRRIDPQATTDMMVPWLQRTAKQITEIPATGRFYKTVAGVARWARTSAGIQALGGNFANMGIHLTQLAPFTRELGPARMADAMAAYIKNPGDIAEHQNELSPELRNRAQIGEVNPLAEIGRILKDQSQNEMVRAIDKNAAVKAVRSVKDWSHDNAYILQAIVWHMTDHIGWHAAYNKALDGEVRGIDSGDSDKSIEYADSLVRRIQGSHNPEDISNIEMRSAWAKIFQFMYGWFNNMGNYTATEKDIIKNSNKTPAAKAASAFYLHLMTAVAVGFGAEVISGTVRGATPSQNDKYQREGSVAQHWLEELGVSLARWEGAKVPYLNTVVNAVISKYTDKNYADHLAASPIFDQIDTILRTPGELWNAMHGHGTNATAIGDLLSSLGFITSTPLSALKKPAKFLTDVNQGKERPKDGLEMVRGILGGPKPKK